MESNYRDGPTGHKNIHRTHSKAIIGMALQAIKTTSQQFTSLEISPLCPPFDEQNWNKVFTQYNYKDVKAYLRMINLFRWIMIICDIFHISTFLLEAIISLHFSQKLLVWNTYMVMNVTFFISSTKVIPT